MDPDVYEYPAKLTYDAEVAFLYRLKEHITEFKLKTFEIVFHGGEPMLFGKRRFIEMMEKLHKIMLDTNCLLQYSMTTNGVLIDEDWAQIFKLYDIKCCISIDGPKSIHDARRPDLRGNGSYEKTVRGIRCLQAVGMEPGIIAVCDPTINPRLLLETFVDELNLLSFDILIPDANHESKNNSISKYYVNLINLWFDEYLARGVRIRILDGMIRGILELESGTQSIGRGRVKTVVLNPDGSIEPLDVLRIAGHNETKTKINVFNNSLQSIVDDPAWISAYYWSYQLSKKCLECPYMQACGGGDLAQRWSLTNGYDNPSVYCDDYISIFSHLLEKMANYFRIESKS